MDGRDEEDDPFAPVEEDSDNPFAKDPTDSEESGNSEAEDGRSTDMAMVDGKVAEGEDEEIDSDEAFGEEDPVKFKSFKFSGSKSRQSLGTRTKMGPSRALASSANDDMIEGFESDDPHKQASEENDPDSDVEVDMGKEDLSSEAEGSDDESTSTASTSPEALKGQTAASSDREALKAILANDNAAFASALSAAAESDAKKGKAFKQQYQTFDRLLDARIKLQKGLTAANDLTLDSVTELENTLAIRKAEEAALSLWSTIESIQHSLLDAQQSTNGSVDHTKKRKRPTPATSTTSTADLWSRTQSLETQVLPHNRAVLDKWSSKARAATALPAPQSQLTDRSSQHQNNITAVLDTYLASESERLVAQASQMPHDPSSPNASQSQLTYDDTTFYQSLLRDLIASRSSTSSAALTSSSTALLPSTTRLHTPGSKNKRVDTRASKGRKVRYTVHEKLQNFAAEEERGTWEEGARREFFGSLFGARRMLDEDDRENRDVEEEEVMVDGEAEALRLFRN